MPVDLGGPNSIVQAYLGGMESARRQKELELEKQRLAQEKELRTQQLQQEHEYQQGELNVRGKQLDLESAMHELAKFHAEQQLGEAVTKGAPIPSGSPITNVDYGQTDEGPKTITFNSPITGKPMTVEAPEEYKRSLIEETGKLAEAKEAPERKTKLGIADITTQREALKEYMKSVQQSIEGDANRQSREKIADINGAWRLRAAQARGTSQRTSTLAAGISNHFDTHRITKDYETLKEINDLVDKGTPNDYDLLLAYGKALTPSQNGVPVSNIQVMQELPSIAARLNLKWDSVTADKQFLSENIRNHIKSTVKNRFKFQENAYDGLRSNAASKLKTIGESPENWLNDYKIGIEDLSKKNEASDQELLDRISGKKK